MSSPVPGTVLIYGPVYQRTGFGMLARVWTFALHEAGLKVKVAPMDCNDQSQVGGLDDCDIRLLRSLEHTKVTPPRTAIFACQPTYVCPQMGIPDPHVRIMLTTFDSSAGAMPPPYRQIFICNQMDQTWLANATEVAAWVSAGLQPEKARSFNWPHDWIGSSRVDQPRMPVRPVNRRFRFLHVSCFLPRRRLDTLLRAFFQEHPTDQTAELYLKMTFPSWHPVSGKPRRDFFKMLETIRRETGSRAPVIVDEALGTRLDMARLMDSCDAYVASDTTMTTPVAEAMLRMRLPIITEGWGVDLPQKDLIVVPNSTRIIPLTAEMAEYMPHQRGKSFQAVEVTEMRHALRTMFTMPEAEMTSRVCSAYEYMCATYSCKTCAVSAVTAIQEAWQWKRIVLQEPAASGAVSVVSSGSEPAAPPVAGSGSHLGGSDQGSRPILWSGPQLFHGKVPAANRAICLDLLSRGRQLSLIPADDPYQIEELELKGVPEFERLAQRFYAPPRGPVYFDVTSHWHPIFQESNAARHVLLNTWWSGAIPIAWRRPVSSLLDEIWVPSEHVKQHFIAGGAPPERVQVIPFGVNAEIFRRRSEPFPLKTPKGFRFLFVGEAGVRKGFDTLLMAYARAFTDKDDVCLIVKDMNCDDYYVRSGGRKQIEHYRKTPGLPEVEYLDTMLDPVSLARLYSSCDCFVQPFRTASSGQCLLEAMACGLPVIATRYGGPLDFCNDDRALLLDARKYVHQPNHVGRWRVDGLQGHAEIQPAQLTNLLREVYGRSSRASQCARNASDWIRTHRTWGRTVDRIEERFAALERMEPRSAARSSSPRPVSKPKQSMPAGLRLVTSPKTPVPGTVLLFAPFHNRSGYGVAARALAATWHEAGVVVRCVPVDNREPGIDDCDTGLLERLEKTKVTGPVTAVFFHVASPRWLQVELPPGTKRILYTTFDSSAQGNTPPPEWIRVCNAMDQVWLMTVKEAEVFILGGVDASRIRVLPCPHPWVGNPLLPLPRRTQAACPASGRFRFISVAMFLPRRRWDTLIESFLSEFAHGENVELYLKVNFPTWHPVPGQPKRDLLMLIERLRASTKSNARIIVDDSLGTRRQICELMDGCQVCVSTDTAVTAPVGEAFVRMRPVILADGLGAKLPLNESAFVVPVDPGFQRPITEEELLYQPHHRGRMTPLLSCEDLRRSLRAAYELPLEQRQEMGNSARLAMENSYGCAVVVPGFVRALRELWTNGPVQQSVGAEFPQPVGALSPVSVEWQGTFLDYGSLSLVNRELTEKLACQPHVRLTLVSQGPNPEPARIAAEFQALADRLQSSPSANTEVTVRHAWPPNWKRPAHGKLVVIQPWEFGVLPQDWVRQSRNVDEFWVPSQFVRRCYVDSGVETAKVHVVPNGVDPARFHPQVAPMKLATAKTFKFLFVGGTIGRKGPDVLLSAYLQCFTAADDVCLVIKDFGGRSIYRGQTFEAQIRAAQARPNAPEILYLNEEMAPDELPGLYTACDCLAHPYRGEGFGLPILEAMACGLPVIVTAGGASDDFAGDEFAYRLPSKRVSIGEKVGTWKLAGMGWLLEPDVQALAEQMKWITVHREAARAKGSRASEYVRQYWTWQRAAEIAAQRLQMLARTPTAASAVAAQTKQPEAESPLPRELPACARLGQLQSARERLGRNQLPEAWGSVIGTLHIRPFHPEAHLLLAEIAAAAGAGIDARRCAQHARNLAPGWKAPKQFLKKARKGNAHPDWMVWPKAVSDSRTEGQKRLSVCLITKNEEKFLAQCLKSVREIATQIIVVDTGSTDRTVEIAKEHGAEVHSFEWCDDFSAPRNAALEHATGDWILMLDADEELSPEGRNQLAAAMDDPTVLAWRLPIVNVGREQEGCAYVPRLFRNVPGAYYYGRIHEQVFPSLLAAAKGFGLRAGLSKVGLLHHGYASEVVKERNKAERNLALVRMAVAENPTDDNLVMNLGLELVRAGDLQGGLAQYRKAFQIMSGRPPTHVPAELREAMLTYFTRHLYVAGLHEEVVEVLASPLAKRSELTASLDYALGLSHFQLQNNHEAAEHMRQCLAKRHQPGLSPANTDIFTAAPQHCLALCWVRLGNVSEAENVFQTALLEHPESETVRLDYARFLAEQNRPVDALHQLHETVARNAAHEVAWRLGGEIALSRPEFLEFARDWTGEALKARPENSAITRQRAEALLLNGETTSALSQWENLQRTEPSAKTLAALILCQSVESATTDAPEDSAEELAVSRAFIEWYQRLIAMRAQTVVAHVNEQLDKLARALPTAADMLRTALAEAEPCARN